MPKKRRVTPDQARLLAIRYIQQAIANEAEFGSQIIPAETRPEQYYYGSTLPERWTDGQTSNASWNALAEIVSVELMVILKGLDREAVRVTLENPEFRYTVKYPLTNGVAAKTV